MLWNLRYIILGCFILSVSIQCKQKIDKSNFTRQIDKNWVLHMTKKDTFLAVNIPSNVHSDLFHQSNCQYSLNSSLKVKIRNASINGNFQIKI